jgi:hypothetical protein
MGQPTTTRTSSMPWLGLMFLLVGATTVQVLLALAALIPYVGGFFEEFRPVLAFFVLAGIGMLAAGMAAKLSVPQRKLVLACALIAATAAFVSSYVANYYTYPARIVRAAATEKKLTLTYARAAEAMKSSLIRETGSAGILAYALYTERLQLSARSLGKFIGSQFADVDDLDGILSAIINIALHTIPWLLKLFLCDVLEWISEPGIIGCAFWYLFSLALSYFGFIWS